METPYYLIHEARYKRILREIWEIGEEKLKILDVGCFPYHLGKALEKLGHDVWGVASAHEPIKNKHVAILNIETDPFPYKDNFFDLIICSEVLEHLIRSPLPAIQEMKRVTRPGGSLLLTTPNANGSITRIKHLLKYPENADTNVYHRHNHEYTLRELAGLIRQAGWRVTTATRFISYHPFRRRNRTDNPFLWTGKFINFLAMSALPHLRDTLLVIGEKKE